MSVLRQVTASSIVIAIGGALGYLIYTNRPIPQSKPVVAHEPLVRAVRVLSRTHRFTVRSRGTVHARTESQIVSEVTGRVLACTPAFEVGAFFEPGDLLARIEAVDYELEVVRGRATLASAETVLAQRVAEAETSLADWKREHGEEPAPPLVAREPQLEEARAAVAAARGLVARAERDLARCEIRAPYRGRVRTRNIDRGGFVTRGTPLGSIYAIDFVEVRLPITPDDVAFVDLPASMRRGATESLPMPTVTLSAVIGGTRHTWDGAIVRTEGEIDLRTRMIHAIARIEDPYAIGADNGHAHGQGQVLAIGQFVEADIVGKTMPGIVRIPRAALRDTVDGFRVLIFDDGALRSRAVNIVRRERDEVLVKDDGFNDGERLVVSPLEVWSEGMRVRLAEDAGSATGGDREKAR
ncbi:MAG: efflux RND transporter periplasmic adaptor subunit [Planctomycetes bacterium]|nr:efflux RND transporter periplasmic adaptor subunit [Planctomycetota bacterium]